MGRWGLAGADAGEMGCATGGGDNDLEAPVLGTLAVVQDLLRGPVGRCHVGFEGDFELAQGLRALLHRGPVRFGSHQNADEGVFRHNISVSWLCCQGYSLAESGFFQSGATWM